ncbi:unnamed protein product [Brassica napus]|uniref:(rape) hypothetical protein n=1 Tax=Brassica napus TaxID=3708 RepID=A0A816NFX4_BRANA|nr:unnamed protein product [Brassica napus]
MAAEKESEQQENLAAMKLPVLPIKPNSHSHSMSSPIHSSIAASVPFSWEEEPGKPKQHSSSSSSSSSSPLTSSPQTHKSLELPPRLHSLEKDGGKLNSPITVFDGPYSMTRSRRLDSPSFRMMVKGSGDCYGSFRSDMYGDLDDVDEETKQESMSSGGSLALVKKRRGLGFFGFSRRRALKRKTEFGRGSYVFPSSVERESESGKKEEEEGEDKRFGYGDGDGITCSQSSRFCEVNIANISRTGSLSTLPTPSSSSKSHFWTNVYAGLKQVVPWKNKKTTAALRLLNSISSSSAAASLPHRFGGLLTNHRRLMADSSFSVAIRRAASFISAVLRSDRGNTVLEEAAICAVLTNAVEVQDRAGVAIGIAVYGSRFSWINHSCSPNACYRFVISPPPHSTTTSSFQETLPRITNTDKEHFSSNYEGAVRYGPKVIVRSIKGIKSGEEITVSYIDLLQPTGLRQSDLWSKYRFICNCGRCAASPPAYVDSILEGVVALDHDELTTVGHHDGAATVGKMTSHINKAIDDFLSDDIDPATCCEKIEGVLHHGILDSSSLRLHPSHHAALHAYITLASAYRIRSIDSETDDFGRAFEMSRIGAAYSLFLAGVSHHLVSAELSFAISAANFWTRAGESLLELASKFLMESSGEYDDDDVKCSKCLMLVENHGEIKENFNQILKCAVTDSDSSQVAWSFLTRGCPYLQKFKSSVDFSFTGNHCKREESKSVDQRVSILLLSFHCLLYADLLTDLCYGRKSHSVS